MIAVILADSPSRLTICDPGLDSNLSVEVVLFPMSSGFEGGSIEFKYLAYGSFELVLFAKVSYAVCVQFGSPR